VLCPGEEDGLDISGEGAPSDRLALGPVWSALLGDGRLRKDFKNALTRCFFFCGWLDMGVRLQGLSLDIASCQQSKYNRNGSLL